MYSQPAIFTITRFPINIQSNKITKTKNSWISFPPPPLPKETLGVKDLGVQTT
jgi:hypothetical protein